MVMVYNDYSGTPLGRILLALVKSKFNDHIFYNTYIHRFSLDGFNDGCLYCFQRNTKTLREEN